MAVPLSPVQAIQKTSASAASVTTTGVTTTASGSLFIVGIAAFTNTLGGATPVTDNKGNTYTKALGPIGTTNGFISIYYCANASGGAGHTFTFTPTASDFIAIGVLEVQGAATATPLNGTNSSSASGTSHSSGNITSGTTPEIFFGFGAVSFGNENTPALGSSLWYSAAMQPDGAVEGLAMAWRVVDTSVTDQFTYTVGASHNEGVAVAGFKAASSGSGGASAHTFFGGV